MKLTNTKLAYSPKSAAEAADASLAFIWEKISSGEIRSFKIGAKRLIAAEDLEAWLASYRNGGAVA